MVRQIGAALTAGALSLFSGGIIGHALSVSTTTLTSATNPSVWGQPVVFTATITPVAPAPTGTVTFQDGGSQHCRLRQQAGRGSGRQLHDRRPRGRIAHRHRCL